MRRKVILLDVEMTYDIFTYNGERKILQLRLNVLSRYVDKFIICEAKTTFSGNDKPLYFGKDENHFKEWWPKIEYFVIDEDYSEEETKLAESSPNTYGAAHWKREFLQKESLHKAMKKYNVQDEDTVYIGDVDEIWEPYEPKHIHKLKLLVYAYYLNQRSNEEFWGTIVAKYKNIKNLVLNHVRTDPNIRTELPYGWHFTSMGGLDEVRRKLNDSYTKESYNTDEVQELLPQRLFDRQDYLGRNFTFWKDEQDWPLYLTKHKFEYRKLCL